MKSKSTVYRVAAVSLEANSLRVRFSDGTEGLIPCQNLLPRSGTPDWSRLSLGMKGAHVTIPVHDGEFAEHEVPWDVLRAFIDAKFARQLSEPASRTL